MIIKNWIEEWLAERKRARNRADFAAGHAYARKCLRSNMERPEVHLSNLVDTARCFNDYSEFDRGIEECLKQSGVQSERA